jgi:chlorite dismutase
MTDDTPSMEELGGKGQRLDRRLFGQLQAFTGCRDAAALAGPLRESGLDAVLYSDVNDPLGVGLFVMAEDPALFAGRVRALLGRDPFGSLHRRAGLTMFGKTYGTGREPDLEFALLKKPLQTALNPAWPWAVWYPLRRRPEFAVLPPGDQGRILGEHAMVGIAYGKADLAHDIRLACYGLDRHDNEFVIGLVGKELAPLSRIVQDMRKTEQTSKYIERLGPFFVGRTVWQSPRPA